MAVLNDDVLLCVFRHCDIDIFLKTRLLSRAVLGLIDHNFTNICNGVAEITFPNQRESFRDESGKTVHDLQWLKRLRFKQLAAILVECTDHNNRSTGLLNADSPEGRHHRQRMTIVFSILADLSAIAKEVADLPEHQFRKDVAFALPDYSGHVRSVMEKRRGITDYDPPPVVGKSALAPVVLDEPSEIMWRRRWTILHRQIDHMKKYQHLWDHSFVAFEEALAYELSGRPQDLRGPRLPCKLDMAIEWVGKPPTALNVLQNRFYWVWTTILDIGPQAFWADWMPTNSPGLGLRDRILELWERETFEEKVTKSLVSKAFFVSRSRVTRHVGTSCHMTRPRAPEPYTVFGVSRKQAQNGTLGDKSRSFAHVQFDFRMQPNDLALHADQVPVENLLDNMWYEGGEGSTYT